MIIRDGPPLEAPGTAGLHVASRVEAASDSDLLAGAPTSPICWLRRGEGLVAWGEAARIPIGSGEDRFVLAEESIQELAARSTIDDGARVPGSGLIALGSFTFSPHAAGSALIVPRIVRGRRDGVVFETRIDPPGAPSLEVVRRGGATGSPRRPVRPRFAGSSRPDHEWLASVATAIERTRSGSIDKAVLARDHRLWSEEPFDIDLALDRLCRRFPDCHTFHIDGLIGATPELLLSRIGSSVASRVLAGTSARGASRADDDALGEALLRSRKDLEEHRFAVESVTHVLERHCIGIEVVGPELLHLDNVQHLATTIEGSLGPARPSSLGLIGELHPTAAVGGSPRAAALAAIAELEGMDRGRYTGPVGWTDADGNGEWGIALRCAEITGDRARLFAGAGIVGASIPEEELAETRLKLAAMRGVLGDGAR